MKGGPVYIYGTHAIDEARAHAPHVLKKVMTSGGEQFASIDVGKLLIPYDVFVATLSPTPQTAILILGGLTDPHNVGAIIRSAAAFSMTAVLMPKVGQAPVTGAVAKTSAGMLFRIPLVTIGSVEEALADLKTRGFVAYGLAGDGSAVLATERFSAPAVFVIGNEGTGLSPAIRSACDKILSIPIHPRAESLNAAQAATVVMYAWQHAHGA